MSWDNSKETIVRSLISHRSRDIPIFAAIFVQNS